MNDFIARLVRYRNSELDDATEHRLLEDVGEDNLLLGSIPFLNWLRKRGTGVVAGPLRLDTPLGVHVRALATQVGEMCDLFVVAGDMLDFRPTVPEAERRAIEAYVVEHPMSGEHFYDG